MKPSFNTLRNLALKFRFNPATTYDDYAIPIPTEGAKTESRNQVVRVSASIRDVPVSNFGPEAGYPDLGIGTLG